MLTLEILKLLALVAMVQYLITCADGRPRFNMEVSSKAQLTQDIVNNAVEDDSFKEDDNSTGEIKDNMNTFLYRPLTAKNNTDGQSVTSIFNVCLQACSQHTHSILELHGCHRECLSDPFKYQVVVDGTDPENLPGELPLENETVSTRPDDSEFGQVLPENEGGQNFPEGNEF